MAKITDLLSRINENDEGDGEGCELHHDIVDALHAVATGAATEEEAQSEIAQAIEDHNPTLSHVDNIMDGLSGHVDDVEGAMPESVRRKIRRGKKVNEMSPTTKKTLGTVALGAGVAAGGWLGMPGHMQSVHDAIANHVLDHPISHAFMGHVKTGLTHAEHAKNAIRWHLDRQIAKRTGGLPYKD